jgi:hypothetical protein
MGLADLIAAYGMIAGSHTGGHFNEASKQGIPIGLNPREFSESWKEPDSMPNRTRMNGAGFEMQDFVSDKLPVVGKREADLANAIYNALYASGLALGNQKDMMYEGGDVGGIAHNSGVPVHRVKQMLYATALADLARSQDDDARWKVRFHATNGAPGLMFDYKW